ncbi:MAG TPA: helix-turn-helix domain-containing protein [Thermoanaerobaculia bacterium]|nr:helix-turn-helix domain-containing protein [Thermoanaerobaculia bacterium]
MEVTTRRMDSPLGCWTFSEGRPAHLAGLVESIGLFEGTTAYPRERVFPNGMLDLIVHLGERYREVTAVGTELCPAVCFTGLQWRPMVVEAPPGPCRVLSVRLHPAGAYALLARPLSEVSGLTVDFQDLVGRAAVELADLCQEAGSAEECIRRTARWLSEHIRQSHGVDRPVAWSAGQIERSGGAVPIASLRERTGLSKSRLAGAFRDQIGVAPKLYARIVRFRRFLARLHEDSGSPLADLALAAGYYDQPHMNAEFRELSGFAPRELLAAVRYPGSISIAE